MPQALQMPILNKCLFNRCIHKTLIEPYLGVL